MKNAQFFVLAILGWLTLAGAAHATACFTWSCNETTRVCSFNTSCSSIQAGDSLTGYKLTYGDGTSTGTSTTTSYSHTYSQNSADVTLEVVSAAGFTELQTIKCYLTIHNVIGPPLPTSGTCTTEP
ncbi:MAG: hypothetical protein ACJ76N_21660 [Thermoanaerobaculia bacterium]